MAQGITLTGAPGDDFLFGTDAAEIFLTSAGFDTLDGLAGDDWYVAARGFRVSAYLGEGDPALFTGQVWKFDAAGFYLGFDVFARIANVAGGEFQDVIFLNWQDNTIDGGPGDDLIDGKAGRDRVVFDMARAPASATPAGAFVDFTGNAVRDPWGGVDFIIHVEDADGTESTDILIGDFQDNHLRGLGGADTLEGRMGDDTLDGGGGGDVLHGGLGDDLFQIRDPGDQAWESAGEGFDTAEIHAAVWSLPEGSDIELLRTALAGASVFGNGFANIMQAGAGPAELNGMGGNDTLIGSAGDDVLRGGAGVNLMSGGPGNDVYEVRGALDRVVELAGEGCDTVFVAADNWRVADHAELAYLVQGARLLHGGPTGQALVANATLGSTLLAGSGQDTLWGSPFADTLDGGAGHDVLYGLGGADLMRGGPGDDAYLIQDAGARIEERPGEGFDQAWVEVNDWVSSIWLEAVYLAGNATRLTGSAGTDALVANQARGGWLLGGEGADTLWGSAFSDTLDGGPGDDVLRGQGGGTHGDTLIGGPGNDVAVVFSSTDSFVERAAEGHDTAYVYADAWLVPLHVEVAYLAGEARLLSRQAGTGFLIGNPFVASTLIGGPGDDILYGGSGDDTLIGNRGNDQFYGGSGADVFRMGPVGFGHDFVFHFSGAGGEGDRLDLRGHAASFAELRSLPTADGVRLELAAGWVELVGLAAGQLVAADVLL